MPSLSDRPFKLGIVANEFFDPELGRTGGFGWAARRVGQLFQSDPSLGVDVAFLSGQHWSVEGEAERDAGGIPLLLQHGGMFRYRAVLTALRHRIDLLLTIDYRRSYDYWLWTLPRTPVVVWSRDPRSTEDVRRVNSLRIPGRPDTEPRGISSVDCSRLAVVARRSRHLGRCVLIANKMPHTAQKAPDVYGLPPGQHVLPNPDLFAYGTVPIRKAERPLVAFVGRLDPIKRPWLFFELARAFPNVDFVVMGRPHFSGPGGWEAPEPPPNLRLLGQLDGERKLEVLASSWVLVNTSIHEETPVSVLEAFACEVPVLSCTDWGGLAERFGVFVGCSEGTGEGALPALKRGLRHLITDGADRAARGRAARAWVESHHNTDRFLAGFRTLCRDVGLEWAGVPGSGRLREIQNGTDEHRAPQPANSSAGAGA